MTELTVRRLPFRFDDTVPFQWHPTNPEFGIVTNAISVIAVAFERYIIAVVRQAIPHITDPEAAAEADAFLRQEAQHARAHRGHLNALVDQHPGLRATIDEAIASYDELLDEEDLDFHLAYIADLEATFTPLFTMMLDARQHLFAPGHARVASLFTWHFVEEIEHRSSALVLYDAVVPDPRYRMRIAPRVARHVLGVYRGVVEGFEQQVPVHARLVSTARVRPAAMWRREATVRLPVVGRRLRADRYPTTFQQVPNGVLLGTFVRLLLSQRPGHRPAHERLPDFADTWFAAWDRGEDMTSFAAGIEAS